MMPKSTTVPAACGGASMVADAKHNRLILFGGRIAVDSTNPRAPLLSPTLFRNELHVIKKGKKREKLE